MAELIRIYPEQPTLIVSEEEVTGVLPLSRETFQMSNEIAKRVLTNPSGWGGYDKIVLDFGEGNPKAFDPAYSGDRLPVKMRAMMGVGRFSAGVKILGGNEHLPGKRASSLIILSDRNGLPVIIMGGDNITNDRMASSIVAGVEALAPHDDYILTLMGVGGVGKATLFALSALPHQPKKILVCGKSKGEYQTVSARLAALVKSLNVPLTGNVQPVENLKEGLRNTEVVVDAIASPAYRQLITNHQLDPSRPLTYADASKLTISPQTLRSFQKFFADSLPLARKLPSPFQMWVRCLLHETVYDDEFHSLASVLNGMKINERRCYYFVVGVPHIDIALAEEAIVRLAQSQQFREQLERVVPADVFELITN